MADIIAEVQTTVPSHGPIEMWPRPVYDGQWTDESGVRWQIRGGRLDGKSMRRLLKRGPVTVLHAYDFDVRVLHGKQRYELLVRVEAFLRDEAPPFSGFELAEFRNLDRQVMLVVQESC